MSDKGKKDRGEALKSRLSGPSEDEETAEGEETAENSETSETAETMSASETAETAESTETVKDRKNVNMYLPEDLVGEMNIRYSELDAQFQREHGRSMEKNRDFYPIILELAFERMEELGTEGVVERME